MNLKRKAVELKTSPHTSDPGALQKVPFCDLLSLLDTRPQTAIESESCAHPVECSRHPSCPRAQSITYSPNEKPMLVYLSRALADTDATKGH